MYIVCTLFFLLDYEQSVNNILKILTFIINLYIILGGK